MRALIGQAAWSTAWLLHRIAHAALLLLLLAAIALGALAWRLSRGPLELAWLIPPLERAANAGDGPLRLTIASASLAWEGFAGGTDRPLDIRLADVAAVSADGARIAELPNVVITLSAAPMLFGRIVPRSIEVDAPQIHVVRARDGAITLDLGAPTAAPSAGPSPVADALTELAQELLRPTGTDSGAGPNRWAELRRLRIRDAAIAMEDRQLGLTWQAPRATLDLQRPSRGGLSGSADIALVLGDQQARLTAQAAPDGPGIALRAQLTPLTPARLAGLAPPLAPLAPLDAPVALSGSAALGADFALTHLSALAEIAAGHVRLGSSLIPLLGASLVAQGTLHDFELRVQHAELAPRDDGPPTTLRGSAAVQRDAGMIQAAIGLDLDKVAFADLPALWPEGVGGEGARDWVTSNITGGTARDGHLDLSLRLPDDFSDATLTSLGGGIDGHDLTVHWLSPIPPIEHGEARLAFVSPDLFEIAVRSGRQGGLAIRQGKVRLSGLAADDQFADIEADITGPLADTLTLLRHPRLRLFDRRPLTLRDPAGQVAADLTVAHLPLKQRVALDDIQIHATAKLTDVHLGDVVAGRDLDQGAFDLDVGNDGMKLTGTAQVIGVPAQLQAELDFRNGPPSQVLQSIKISATPDARQLAAAGLDSGGLLTGPAVIGATLQSRRDGRGEATVHADLARAGLRIDRLNWSKPPGKPAAADFMLALDHDQLTSIDKAQITGDGIDASARLDFSAGHPTVARLQRLRLGTTTDAHGEVHWPAGPGAPWIATVSGPSIDATGEFSHGNVAPSPSPGERPPKPADDRPGAPWTVDAQFDRVVLGPNRGLDTVRLHAENDGRVTRQARLTGATAGNAPFSITIAPAARGRSLSGDSTDAGGLLRAFDVVQDLEGGRLTITGDYDDASAAHPLSGTAEITDFRLRNAPAVGKLLQAMTLYGLVELLQGPGMGFSQLVAPFRLTGDVLELSDARAYSPSLGMTAKGRIDLAGGACNVQGTIVPAYFFNSLLGNIPLVGRLFSPERGGGVFAASYSLTGPCDDPAVGINPLAALTPGFLRGLFGIFQGDADPSPAPVPKPRSNQ